MIFKKEGKIMKNVMLKHDIPFHLCDEVHDIIWFGHIKEEKFDEIVEYLKERATRDCYNRDSSHPDFSKELLYDWIFYLRQYAFYIKNILHKGVHWLDMDKYLFPNDVYDITYKYQNAGVQIFLEYMQEKYPESLWEE